MLTGKCQVLGLDQGKDILNSTDLYFYLNCKSCSNLTKTMLTRVLIFTITSSPICKMRILNLQTAILINLTWLKLGVSEKGFQL